MKGNETEKEVEGHLRNQIKLIGGIAYKFSSPNRRSVPDRMIVLPRIPVFFVECKTEHSKLTSPQSREIKRLRNLGKKVFVVHSRKDVSRLMRKIENELKRLIQTSETDRADIRTQSEENPTKES